MSSFSHLPNKTNAPYNRKTGNAISTSYNSCTPSSKIFPGHEAFDKMACGIGGISKTNYMISVMGSVRIIAINIIIG